MAKYTSSQYYFQISIDSDCFLGHLILLVSYRRMMLTNSLKSIPHFNIVMKNLKNVDIIIYD